MSLTQDQLDEYKACFRTFDAQGKGSLTLEECAMALRSLGYDIASSYLRPCDYNGFVELVSQTSQHLTDKEAMLFQALSVFDVDGTGWADEASLQWALTSLGEPLGADEAQGFAREAQAQQGQVHIETLVRRLCLKA